MNKVDVVVCTCNNIERLNEVLNSIKDQSFRDFKCWVVNDGGNEETGQFVRKNFSWVNYLKSDIQQGPSKNRNIAIAQGKAKYVVVLDDDIKLGKDWLKEMVALMDLNPQLGIADALQPYHFNTFEKEYCCTAAMIARRAVFNDIGLFDETYFYGLEDCDFSLRAIRKGWKIKTNHGSEARHLCSYTVKKFPSNFKRYLYWKNYIRTILKNYPKRTLALKLPYLACKLTALSIKDAIKRKAINIPKAVLWNLLNIADTLRRRWNHA